MCTCKYMCVYVCTCEFVCTFGINLAILKTVVTLHIHSRREHYRVTFGCLSTANKLDILNYIVLSHIECRRLLVIDTYVALYCQ